MGVRLQGLSRGSIGIIAVWVVVATCGCAGRSRPPSPAGRPEVSPEPATLAGFAQALPGYRFQFPGDSGSHPTYRTEWWYYTGHLQGADKRYGFELTFFRVALQPHASRRASRWAASNIYLAHFAITDVSARQFHYDERADRGSLDLSGSASDHEKVWIGDWRATVEQVRGQGDSRMWPHAIQARSSFGDLRLELTPKKPPVIQGQDGVSLKGPGTGQASHYYSYTRLSASGILEIGGQSIPVTGLAWMDHEFASDQLSPDEVGWDWFSVQLDDGWDLMLYRLRLSSATHQTGAIPDGRSGWVSPYSSGILVSPSGRGQFLNSRQFEAEPAANDWTSPRTGATYPVAWQIRVPSARLSLHEEPETPDQELVTKGSTGVTYWEGTMQVDGQVGTETVRGEGYTELTGYDGAMDHLR